jgi:hypothetical protein
MRRHSALRHFRRSNLNMGSAVLSDAEQKIKKF